MGSFNFGSSLKNAFSAYGNFVSMGATGAFEQMSEGADMAEKAKSDIENFKRQELDNVYKDLSVSTLGADIRREESARATATAADLLAKAGSRGVVGGVQGLVQSSQMESARIAAYMDEQKKELDRLVASDEATIRGIQEQRDYADLAGLGSMYQIGMSMKEAGQQQFGELGGKVGSLLLGAGGMPTGLGGSGGAGQSLPSGTSINYDYTGSDPTNNIC